LKLTEQQLQVMEVQLSNLQEIHLEALPDGLQLPHIELRVGQVQQAVGL
jgi:hypothetical protein